VWVALVVVGAIAFVALNAVGALVARDAFESYRIQAENMTPALRPGDRVLAERLSYELHDPHRGDIVVFDAPARVAVPPGITQLISRVVGLPGETIEGRDGRIYIDGRPLDESYLDSTVENRAFGPLKIGPDRYFVMGDNRMMSKDSVYFGPIPGASIDSRIFLRLWPPGRFTLI
jgi:signal peptidase I